MHLGLRSTSRKNKYSYTRLERCIYIHLSIFLFEACICCVDSSYRKFSNKLESTSSSLSIIFSAGLDTASIWRSKFIFFSDLFKRNPFATSSRSIFGWWILSQIRENFAQQPFTSSWRCECPVRSWIFHQISKICRLRIARKHGIVYHTQRTAAKVDKFTRLSGAVLKLNNCATTCFVRPEISIGFICKPHENSD
jgi:hypothetical protein